MRRRRNLASGQMIKNDNNNNNEPTIQQLKQTSGVSQMLVAAEHYANEQLVMRWQACDLNSTTTTQPTVVAVGRLVYVNKSRLHYKVEKKRLFLLKSILTLPMLINLFTSQQLSCNATVWSQQKPTLASVVVHNHVQSNHKQANTQRFNGALKFPSERYVYPRASQALDLGNNLNDTLNEPFVDLTSQSNKQHTKLLLPQQSTNKRLLTIQAKLQQLKQQLENELTISEWRNQNATTTTTTNNKNNNNSQYEYQTQIGSMCLHSSDCQKFIERSHCDVETNTCTCLPQHVQFNTTTCLQPSLLGYKCLIDAQCQQKVPESICSANKCVCPADRFVTYRKNKCLAPSLINDYCLTDSQCQLNDKHSFCKWKIQNVYGTCKCPLNYKLLNVNERLKCGPRLGDSCLSDAECQMTTPNSTCQDVTKSSLVATTITSLALRATTTWQTSRASSRRCACSSGFMEASNQLDCVVVVLNNRTNALTSTNSTQPGDAEVRLNESQKYEMLLVVGQEVDGNKKVAAAAAGGVKVHKQGENVVVAINQTTTTQRVLATRATSLGKACTSRDECRARDKYSDCIEGVCECLRPTSKCSASKNGCHADTFQCRNGQCVSWYFVCDSFKNCADGSDEDECLRGACPRHAYQCHSDGACVARGKVCDGKRDCADASDEINCGANTQTNVPQRTTATAMTNASACRADAFECRDGQCLPAYVFCNAVEDCADGSDEDELVCEFGGAANLTQFKPTHAATATATPVLPADESPLVKTDRASIERLVAALALTRAPDKRRRQSKLSRPFNVGYVESSHADWPRVVQTRRQQVVATTTSNTQTRNSRAAECPAWAFACRNGKCRSSAILCSGVDGCGDNSDEDKCEVCQCEPIDGM